MSDPYGLSDPPNLATLWGRLLVDELARCGLRRAVIAPGSRSTPLALAFSRHPDVEDLSVIDERSAAFVALGLGRASGALAAVLSTSGTAAANFLPAVVEADRAAVPLLVLTADRPPELRDAGDSQSADQVKLYGDRVRWFHAVAEPFLDGADAERRLRYLRSTACHAWALASGAGGPPGPVHLDLPFSKPLEPTPVEAGSGRPGALPAGFDPAASPASAGRPGGAPWVRVEAASPAADPEAVEELALELAGARRPLVLAGAAAAGGVEGGRSAADGRLRSALARLLAVLPLPVWAEATSGLRLGWAPERPPSEIVATGGLLLAAGRFRERLAADPPDLVLRLGEAPIGWAERRLLAELASSGDALQVAVDPWGRRRDPDHAVARLLAADPAALLDGVARRLEEGAAPVATDSAWLALHRRSDRSARRALERAAAEVDALFDGGVLHHLGRVLPEDAALFVSSSMPLREVELFLPELPQGRGPVDVFANRGVNGIDGVTSTALGVALARRVAPAAGGSVGAGGSRTVLVTGDVAFVHDLSGVLAAGRLAGAGGARGGAGRGIPGLDLAIVVIDNGGGAIFDHLPAAAFEPGFTRHLVTPPGADLEALARGCGLGYRAPGSWEELEEAVASGFDPAAAGPAVRVIHVRTGRERSKRIRGEVIAEVARAVDGAVEG